MPIHLLVLVAALKILFVLMTKVIKTARNSLWAGRKFCKILFTRECHIVSNPRTLGRLQGSLEIGNSQFVHHPYISLSSVR